MSAAFPLRAALPLLRAAFGRIRGTGAVAMRLLALLAMLLQVALFTDHIGASAVAGVQGPQLAGAQHSGLLQICTGEGVVLLGPDGSRAPTQGNGGHGGGSCPVCSSSSMCSFDAPAAVAAPVFQAELVAPPFLPIRHDQVQALHQRILAPIRAPPLA